MHTETVLESNDIEMMSPVRMGDTLGNARVSTNDQNPDVQRDRLIEPVAGPGVTIGATHEQRRTQNAFSSSESLKE